MARWLLAVLFVFAVGSVATEPSSAAPEIAGGAADFDDPLGGGLLLDGLDDLIAKSEPPAKESPAPRGDDPSWLPNRKELDRMLKEGRPSPQKLGEDLGESPLVLLRSSMDLAGRLIAKGDDGSETRPTQETIVDQLDELIKEMEKQCQNCQSSSESQNQQQSRRSKPSQPKEGQAKNGKPAGQPKGQSAAKQSSVRLGQAEAAKSEAAKRAEVIKRVWGRLPERLREQMLQSSSDEFLPEYREDIEQYFERLAEDEE